MAEKLPPSSNYKSCPGCLYNCYIIEENLGLDFSSIRVFLRSVLFILAEIPTIIQIAKITSKRKEVGWGKGLNDFEVK